MGWIVRYWIQVLFGFIATLGVCGYRKINRKLKEQDAMQLGVQALLRDRIYQAYFYHCERGCFPLYARENVEELFKQYTALHGNGTVHELVDRLQRLPVEGPKLERGDSDL